MNVILWLFDDNMEQTLSIKSLFTVISGVKVKIKDLSDFGAFLKINNQISSRKEINSGLPNWNMDFTRSTVK
jgi:hypothetical protein